MKFIPTFLKPWLVALLAVMVGWLVRLNVDNASPAQLLFDIPVDQVSTIQLEKAGRTPVPLSLQCKVLLNQAKRR